MVVEQTIQPFTKDGSDIKTNEMGVHSLPWPKDQLLDLGATKVTMRVTLSYFIEPKPGRREGFVKHRHRYQLHGLRFEVKRPSEALDEFRKRISQACAERGGGVRGRRRHLGLGVGAEITHPRFIHCDWWTGTAADLANSGVIAVYPVSGWWRESKGNDWSKETRYALLVSIKAEPVRVAASLFTPTEIDFYTPVKTTILSVIEQEVTTEVEGEEPVE